MHMCTCNLNVDLHVHNTEKNNSKVLIKLTNIVPTYNINKLMMCLLIILAYYTMNMYFALSQMLPVSTTLKKNYEENDTF